VIPTREIIAFENVTLDGLFSGPNGEYDWATPDPEGEVTRFVKEGGPQAEIDTYLFGRKTYDMMASFWPTPAGRAANPQFADALNRSPKIVVSSKMKEAGWNNTTIMNELSRERVLKLKRRPGKGIMIFGSGSIIQQLTDWGLIDEYQLMVNPLVLGRGAPLFKGTKGHLRLKLTGSKTFSNGVVLLKYRLVKVQ
jgi:dihydrofolate reductase